MSADKWLDDVAKTLARGHSRRDLLRGIGVALAGAVLMAFSSRRTHASQDCVEICRDRGLTGREFGDCVATCESGIPCGKNRCDSETEYCATCRTLDGVESVCLPNGAVC